MREALWGENWIGVRRLQSLTSGLPLESAVVRSYDPDRLGVGWGWQEDLLATLAELVDQTNRLIFAFNTKKGTRIPDAIFIPRPGRVRTRRAATPEELKSLLNKRGIPVVGRKAKKEQ